MIYPTDVWKFAWDCLSCAAVLYAVAEIPFTIGFLSDSPDSFAATVLDDFLVVIFGIEIILAFNSAYVEPVSGILITDRKKIAIRYCKFWLWIDLASMLPVKQIGIAYTTAFRNDLNIVQLVRLLRLSRLAFVYKLMSSRRLSSFMDHISFSPQLKNMTLLFLQIFLTGHVLCCFWFFITTSICTGRQNPSDDSLPFLIRTWAVEFGYEHKSVFDQYVGSLYWTFETLFTIGYGDIHATNQGERVFSILVMLMGSVLFGAVLAKIKDVLDSTNIQKNEVIAKMEEFNEYMYEKNFPSSLRRRAKVRLKWYTLLIDISEYLYHTISDLFETWNENKELIEYKLDLILQEMRYEYNVNS
jgi:potassium channel